MCMGYLSLAGENAHGAQIIHLIKSYASQVEESIGRLFKQFASRRKLPFKRVFNLNMFNASGARDRV
jgi:hypothetical protein